jgi:hypothetical protein
MKVVTEPFFSFKKVKSWILQYVLATVQSKHHTLAFLFHASSIPVLQSCEYRVVTLES